MTDEQFWALKPCDDAAEWIRQQPSLYDAWERCSRGQWLWWLAFRLALTGECMRLEKLVQSLNTSKAMRLDMLDFDRTALSPQTILAFEYAYWFQLAEDIRAIVPNPFTKPNQPNEITAKEHQTPTK